MAADKYSPYDYIPPRTRQPHSFMGGGMASVIGDPVLGNDPLSSVVRATSMEWYGQLLKRGWLQFEALRTGLPEADPDYRVHEDPTVRPYLAANPEAFEDVSSPQEAWRVARTMSGNMRTRKETMLYNDSMATGLLAGVVDPTNFVPIPLVKGGQVIAKIHHRAAVGAAATIPALGVGVYGTEVVRHKLDPTSTPQETAMRIGAGTLFAGAIGGAAGIMAYRPPSGFGSMKIMTKYSDSQYNRMMMGVDEGGRVRCLR